MWYYLFNIRLQENQYVLADSLWSNPFDEQPNKDSTYLSYHSSDKDDSQIKGKPDEPKANDFIACSIMLADIKIVRSRTVYSLITLISEVSGFADVFIVGGTFLFGSFYTPFFMEVSLVKHCSPIQFPKRKKQ